MAILTMHAPMPRMLGYPTDGFLSLEVPLAEPMTLADFFLHLGQKNPDFNKVLLREYNTYFEQVRIFIDGVMAVSDDYSGTVRPDSEVALLPPYVDG